MLSWNLFVIWLIFEFSKGGSKVKVNMSKLLMLMEGLGTNNKQSSIFYIKIITKSFLEKISKARSKVKVIRSTNLASLKMSGIARV
jgi:aspartyl/asparaginyl beta-hydroxylase (cupin superfamily)